MTIRQVIVKKSDKNHSLNPPKWKDLKSESRIVDCILQEYIKKNNDTNSDDE